MIDRMSGNLMIQGTMSGVGKSLITAGLCRILKQDGRSPAPFKSQNMALNSFVTKDGREIGRAQAMQAFAAGCEPRHEMNPILLKPTGDTGSQVIVNGRPIGNMSAREYFEYKSRLIPVIKEAYHSLSSQYDPVIIEGAGSPAEINLKDNDIVNMGIAKMFNAPVLLAADIDRGGVFAQLYGTVMLLPDDERKRIRGFIINKFRGDPTLLDSGIKEIEEKTGIPVIGVIPYMPEPGLEDEDSLTEKFIRLEKKDAKITIAVIRLPRISNFSDFDPFEQNKDVSVVYTDDPGVLERADLIIIPGSKNTIDDMRFLHEKGLAEKICRLEGSIPIIGICGGFQMLGEVIEDHEGVENAVSADKTGNDTGDHGECGGNPCNGYRTGIKGLGLLPVNTTLRSEKHLAQTTGFLNENIRGIFMGLSGKEYEGYEIHAGLSRSLTDFNLTLPAVLSTDTDVYGTYIHGIFDRAETAGVILQALADRKGVKLDFSSQQDQRAYREKRYDFLADTLRTHLDMELIRRLSS